MCFWDAYFSSPGRPLGAQSDRKGAQMEPKVIEKVDRRHLVERVKSMAGTVREGHGEVPGRVQESVFCRNALRSLPPTLPKGV